MEWALLTLKQAGVALIVYVRAMPSPVTYADILALNLHDRE